MRDTVRINDRTAPCFRDYLPLSTCYHIHLVIITFKVIIPAFELGMSVHRRSFIVVRLSHAKASFIAQKLSGDFPCVKIAPCGAIRTRIFNLSQSVTIVNGITIIYCSVNMTAVN